MQTPQQGVFWARVGNVLYHAISLLYIDQASPLRGWGSVCDHTTSWSDNSSFYKSTANDFSHNVICHLEKHTLLESGYAGSYSIEIQELHWGRGDKGSFCFLQSQQGLTDNV